MSHFNGDAAVWLAEGKILYSCCRKLQRRPWDYMDRISHMTITWLSHDSQLALHFTSVQHWFCISLNHVMCQFCWNYIQQSACVVFVHQLCSLCVWRFTKVNTGCHPEGHQWSHRVVVWGVLLYCYVCFVVLNYIFSCSSCAVLPWR